MSWVSLLRSAIRSAVLCMMVVVLLGLSSLARGGQIGPSNMGLFNPHIGDVTTAYTDVEYVLNANPATGTLTAVGYPEQFLTAPSGTETSIDVDTSSFTLSLIVNRSDGSVVSGTVSMSGDMLSAPESTVCCCKATSRSSDFTIRRFRIRPWATSSTSCSTSPVDCSTRPITRPIRLASSWIFRIKRARSRLPAYLRRRFPTMDLAAFPTRLPWCRSLRLQSCLS